MTPSLRLSGKTVYLNTRTYLFGSEGGILVEIPSGIHKYEFSVRLPSEVPASFEASNGHIRYNVEAVLDVPWDFDQEFKLPFNVFRVFDLNFHPELKIPCKSEEIKRFSCCFCQSEPLIMTVTVPQSGFVPGEKILVTVDYDNRSDIAIISTKISLKRTIRYKSQTPRPKTKLEIEKIVEVFVAGVDPSSSNVVERYLVLPPSMPNSNEQFCDVVQITYELKVEGETPAFSNNIELSLPITIGSVQFNNDQQHGVAAASSSNASAPRPHNFVDNSVPEYNSYAFKSSPISKILSAPSELRKLARFL